MIELLKTKLNLGRRKIPDLIHLPDMADPDKKISMDILLSLNNPVYLLSNWNLFALIVLKMTNLSLRYGNALSSSVADARYGLINLQLGDAKSCYEFGRLGLKLGEKFNNSAFMGATYFAFASGNNHREKHVRVDIEYFMKAYGNSLKSGDLVVASYILSPQAL